MSKWTVLAEPTAARLCRNDSAVYAIYLDGELVYIGSSERVRIRLRDHNLRWGYANNIHAPWGDDFKTCVIKISYSRRYGDWLMREARLIRRLKPKFNVRGRVPSRRAA